MEKEKITHQIVEYFKKNYGSKIDLKQLPLNGGLLAYLGVDSMHSLEIIIDLESLFRIEITDDLLSFKLVDNIDHMSITIADLPCKKS